MTTTTTYGTWCNHVEPFSTTVEHSIAEALGSYGDEYDIDAIASDYRAAINQALPAGVSLCGDEFIGPAYDKDAAWSDDLDDEDGRLNIKAIVDTVDLWAIAAKHEKH